MGWDRFILPNFRLAIFNNCPNFFTLLLFFNSFMNRRLIFPLVMISILLLAEIGAYLGIRSFILTSTTISIRKFTWLYWGLTVLFYVLLFGGRSFANQYWQNIMINVFFFLLITKLIISLTFIFANLVNWIREWFLSAPELEKSQILASRRKFVSQLAMASAILPISTLSWGLFRTAYNFKIHRQKIASAKIPKAFQGFRILQISDIHTGSLQGEGQLQKAIDIIKEEKPDLIVFTGDLVNNRTDEAFAYKHVLSQLNAPHGVFSTLGNHDYGDYASWDSKAAKDQNMKEMIDLHGELGWKLMLNESVPIEKDGESFTLIGIENWGGNLNFKRYGDLKKAYEKVDTSSFQVLLSHDPSHWNIEVSKDFQDIDLTLSGHTHGFQFGIEIPGFKWSPSKYFYPHWAGIYGTETQQLYVNRGLGCLGYMGRIGIRPEITILELQAV